ncbi:MAG: hypothetical protein ACRCT1_11800 [Microcoleaceae cyanobacterium]
MIELRLIAIFPNPSVLTLGASGFGKYQKRAKHSDDKLSVFRDRFFVRILCAIVQSAPHWCQLKVKSLVRQWF